ncbi:XRE family transcriptional regulator [Rothia nasimurium]|uniref:XRE family transcriptional regulator n=1 Tax=Rothia nasimurium TaxID=85336 RepID=A0A4Y9F5P8_9MICC|nr:helix-turn-helix transcriptional regulator [Rothia nasimurium]MBF0808000.1 helix-turn-helix transcriptional regulator [Rothia nasimurium]TFU22725.1 XRE family transcriptional regulator [Rothia nasimurium]
MNQENHTISYKPLWKLLMDRNMTKQDSRKATGLSAIIIAKRGKDGNITTEFLSRVCATLKVNIDDNSEVIEVTQPEEIKE